MAIQNPTAPQVKEAKNTANTFEQSLEGGMGAFGQFNKDEGFFVTEVTTNSFAGRIIFNEQPQNQTITNSSSESIIINIGKTSVGGVIEQASEVAAKALDTLTDTKEATVDLVQEIFDLGEKTEPQLTPEEQIETAERQAGANVARRFFSVLQSEGAQAEVKQEQVVAEAVQRTTGMSYTEIKEEMGTKGPVALTTAFAIAEHRIKQLQEANQPKELPGAGKGKGAGGVKDSFYDTAQNAEHQGATSQTLVG